MKRLLPPLVVLLILAVVAWRVSRDPRHERDRAWIESNWRASQLDRVREVADAIERYLEEYGTLEERRWFAARAYFELGVAPHAIDTIWKVPEIARQPDTARRLADLYLRTAGFHDPEELTKPRQGANVILMVLADGGDETAQDRLLELVRNAPIRQYNELYFAVLTQGIETSHDILLDGLRRQTEEDPRLAAAVLAAPPSEDELEHMRKVLPDDDRRRSTRLFWGLAAHMLARHGTKADLAAVRARVEALRAGNSREGHADALLAATGLVAAGQWDAEAWLEPALRGPQPDPIKDWYLEALLHRVRQGDATALEHLEAWWETTRESPQLGVRPRSLIELYLGAELPAEDAPSQRLIQITLDDPEADSAERMLLAAIRLRQGDASARTELLAFISTLGKEQMLKEDPGLYEPMRVSPLLQAARALFLYDR